MKTKSVRNWHYPILSCYIPQHVRLGALNLCNTYECKVPENKIANVEKELEFGYVKHSILKTRLTVN
jgi:hypothetical protein